MSDEALVAFHAMNEAEQRMALRLADINVERLEFDRWRIAHGHDPEMARSDRAMLFTRCQCETCKALASDGEPVHSEFVAP